MKSSAAIHPQDVAIVLKLVAHPDRSWRQIDLAHELELSQGEVAKALKRLEKVSIVSGYQPVKSMLKEFLIHSIKFTFPGKLGQVTKGIPTSISFGTIRKNIARAQGVENTYVIPSAEGSTLGQSVEPLYGSIANAALKDEKFYELIAYLDMLRVGKAREKNLAIKYFEKELS